MAKLEDCWYGSDAARTSHAMASTTTVLPPQEGAPPEVPQGKRQALVVTYCTRCGTIGSTKEMPA